MTLPPWIEEVAKESQTSNMANYVPKLIQALSIAWEALEHIETYKKHGGEIAIAARDSKMAMQRISKLGEELE